MPGRYEEGSPPTQEDFTGYEKDEATGLHYAGARYYSAAFGRWTTTEPLLRSQNPRKLLKDGKGRLLSSAVRCIRKSVCAACRGACGRSTLCLWPPPVDGRRGPCDGGMGAVSPLAFSCVYPDR